MLAVFAPGSVKAAFGPRPFQVERSGNRHCVIGEDSVATARFGPGEFQIAPFFAAARASTVFRMAPCYSCPVDLKTAEEVSTPEAQDNRIEHGERAGWLAPIPLEPKRQAVRAKTPVRRSSNKGCLSLGLGDYLQLLDWTGRQIRSDKRGAMPANLEPLFERLGISTELWVDCVVNFRKWFRSSVGRPKSMEAAAEIRGHNRAISINSARRAFT